jgi:hypothetical protein
VIEGRAASARAATSRFAGAVTRLPQFPEKRFRPLAAPAPFSASTGPPVPGRARFRALAAHVSTSAMDAFAYLSVLISIILGLAVEQVLQGYRALILSRRRIRFYAPPLIWSVLLLLMVAQNWWASFGLARRTEWSFALFAIILVQTILLYMMTAIVLPPIAADEEIDLRDHYYREARAFFGISIALILWSVFRETMLAGKLPDPLNLGFIAIFLVLAVFAAASRRPRLHEGFAIVMAVLFGTYIALLFARLTP